MTARLLAPFAALVALVGIVGAVLLAPADESPRPIQRNVAILTDRSRGVEPGDRSSCAGVDWLGSRALRLPDVGEESEIALFTTGDEQGRSNPKLGSTRGVARGFDQGGISYTSALRGREKALADACASNLDPLDKSPIYDSIVATLRDMRVAWGCDATHPCSLYVQSDLQEEGNRAIKAALRGSAKALPKLLLTLPTVSVPPNDGADEGVRVALDTEGVEVFVCGIGASNDAPRKNVKNNLQPVWGAILPGVEMQANCG